MRISRTLFPSLLLAAACAGTLEAADVAPDPLFARPTLVPPPAAVAGIAQAVQPLSNWRMKAAPSGEFWSAATDTSSWTPAGGRGGRGGGGAGAPADGGGEFTSAYRTSAAIPAEWANHRVVVRFDGVAGGAKLWVNGKEVRTHWGSLMAWSADITEFVKPGEEASITLGVDERREGLNAFVRGGGLQKEAMLIVLPPDYVARLHAETTFDKSYKDATLHLWITAAFHSAGDAPAKVKLTLKDPAGQAATITPDTLDISRAAADHVYEVSVPAAQKWDAEHPNLYTLQADLLDGAGKVTQTLSKPIGLREVEVRANQFFFNGNEVKFRGIWGGNVGQIKELNGNHTRQKWVTDRLLQDADTQGLYVLDENPVDFAKYGPESDPRFADQYVSFIADMLERDRDHPSVIMWGLGNESFSGPNVLRAFKYLQQEDRQRPAMFSWANRVPVDQELPYSIYSSHYPNLNDPGLNLGSYMVAKWHSPSLPLQRRPVPVMPVLHDEYSHVVLNQAILTRDPNVRNFWGESIYRYWEKMFVTQGALGGDIFGLSGGFGSGPTENYLARKAYSPIRIVDGPVPNPGANKPLSIPIKNWFDHTNLSAIKITWSVGGESGTMSGPNIAAHGGGMLSIPARAWKDDEKLDLKFALASGTVIDEFLLPVNPGPVKLPMPQGPAPKLEQANGKITITGEHFQVVFDEAKGLIRDASVEGHTVFVDGPYLDLLGSGLAYGEWWCDAISARIDGNEAVLSIEGNYAVIAASFEVRIDGTGLMTTKYTVDHVPGEPPPPTYSPWDATSVGGYSEVGVSYMLPNSTSSLAWKRHALWSVYPADHIGRPEGTAAKGTDNFRATKEHIYEATAIAGEGASATALSDGHDAVRLSADAGYRALPGGIRMGIHNEWNYPDIGLGNYAKPPIVVKDGYRNTVYLRLGNGQGAK